MSKNYTVQLKKIFKVKMEKNEIKERIENLLEAYGSITPLSLWEDLDGQDINNIKKYRLHLHICY